MRFPACIYGMTGDQVPAVFKKDVQKSNVIARWDQLQVAVAVQPWM